MFVSAAKLILQQPELKWECQAMPSYNKNTSNLYKFLYFFFFFSQKMWTFHSVIVPTLKSVPIPQAYSFFRPWVLYSLRQLCGNAPEKCAHLHNLRVKILEDEMLPKFWCSTQKLSLHKCSSSDALLMCNWHCYVKCTLCSALSLGKGHGREISHTH